MPHSSTNDDDFLSAHRTASFKLRSPSARKRAALEHAFTQYTLAFGEILAWAIDHEDTLRAEGMHEVTYRSGETARRWSNTHYLSRVLRKRSGVTADLHSSFVTYLFEDVAASLLSYYALSDVYPDSLARYEERLQKWQANGENGKRPRRPRPPSFPVARDPRPQSFEQALKRMAGVGSVDNAEWRDSQAAVTRLMRGDYMPIYIGHPDAVPNARGFSLLADDSIGRYYALLYLLPGTAEPIETSGNLRRLGHPATVSRTEAETHYLDLTARARSAVVFPLQMGRWHVNEFLEHPNSNVRSAFLFRRGGDYFLNVAFEYRCPALPVETVLGVDRGVAQLVALRALDLAGHELCSELWPGDEFLAFQWQVKREMRRLQKQGRNVAGAKSVRRRIREESDHVTHRLANRIVDLALRYRAQVVIENLKGLDAAKDKFYKLHAAPYQAIAQKLAYKLSLNGLPAPAQVNPAYTSQMCAACGHSDRANRPDQATFVCRSCGHEDHADLNAATNIALRWLKRQDGEDWWPADK